MPCLELLKCVGRAHPPVPVPYVEVIRDCSCDHLYLRMGRSPWVRFMIESILSLVLEKCVSRL